MKNTVFTLVCRAGWSVSQRVSFSIGYRAPDEPPLGFVFYPQLFQQLAPIFQTMIPCVDLFHQSQVDSCFLVSLRFDLSDQAVDDVFPDCESKVGVRIGQGLGHCLVYIPAPSFGFAKTLVKVDHVIVTFFQNGDFDERFQIGKRVMMRSLFDSWRLDLGGG